MKKILLLISVMLSSVMAMAQSANYTSVKLTAEEIDLDNEETIGVIVDGELSDADQMYAQFGMVASMMNNAYLYEGDATEGVKLATVQASWGKPLIFGSDENLKPGTDYKIVIKIGGISTTSYMTMSDIFENKEEITLSFKTKAERTDPFLKSIVPSVTKYQLINITQDGFEGIKLNFVAKNLPTVSAYLGVVGGVRLYEEGKVNEEGEPIYTFCNVSAPVNEGENTITIVPANKLETGKVYTIKLFFEGLYIHNYFDMSKEVCYFPESEILFMTKHDAPTDEGNYTIALGDDAFTINSADDKNFFVVAFSENYLSGKTPAEYIDSQVAYANTMSFYKNTVNLNYSDFYMTYTPGVWYIAVAGAEYDEYQEGGYLTTLPVIKKVTVGEDGKVTSIRKVAAESISNRIFGIDGTQRSALRKGINLVGGKKILVK